MKFKSPDVLALIPKTSSFYGVCHHDAKEVDKNWKSLCTTHSIEDVFGTPKQKMIQKKIDEKSFEK